MAARAVWKGSLLLGEQRVPLKLYSGVEDRSVRFRLLHEPDLVPVRQRLVNPTTGHEVAWKESRRAVEEPDGSMLLLEPDELESLEPEDSRDIRIHRFVPRDAVGPVWYDRPYFLGPDGAAARVRWNALAAALADTGLQGIATWTMRRKRYRGVLRLHEGVPLLITLRSTQEVAPALALEATSARELSARELDMADQLVAMLAGSFQPEEWEDSWRRRVMGLIEAKAAGEVVELREYRQRREPAHSLEDALAASLEQLEERSSA